MSKRASDTFLNYKSFAYLVPMMIDDGNQNTSQSASTIVTIGLQTASSLGGAYIYNENDMQYDFVDNVGGVPSFAIIVPLKAVKGTNAEEGFLT